jgi:acyl-CoA thioester hydrolase
MGYVYYGNYATYYEVARVESFRKLGYAYKNLEDQGVMMPVLELKTKYIQPAKYDDLLTVKVSIPEMPNVRITYHYEIFNEKGTKLNEGETQLVFVDMKKNRPTRIPEIMKNLLLPFYKK